MIQHKLTYEHMGKVLACIKLVKGDDCEFRVSEYVAIHAALYPEDEERLRNEPGHDLAETAGGRLSDYERYVNGENGPRIKRVTPRPDPVYRIH